MGKTTPKNLNLNLRANRAKSQPTQPSLFAETTLPVASKNIRLAMSDNKDMSERLIGIISDTHNLVRPEAVDALRGVEIILHAGDICKPQVLETLNSIAPVITVRGNNDKGEWAEKLPIWEVVKVGVVSIYMIHNLKEIEISPFNAGFHVVVSGHSHKPLVEERGGVLYVNPGSAGPKRFSLPICLAHLKIKGETVKAQVIHLSI